jgi:hypothetical protein
VKPWVWSLKKQAPEGAAENRRQNVSFAPFRGLGDLRLETHGFTVGYYRSLLRSYKWILKTRLSPSVLGLGDFCFHRPTN